MVPSILPGGSIFRMCLAARQATTLGGEFALVNQAQRQQELGAANRAKLDSGFDLIVGNPPFVTARNKEKRAKFTASAGPRVAYMKFLLVSPFFERSFGLLRPDGQFGFIVSNAFAKREFGKPLVEDFFPTVDLQKVIDCSGPTFPGHGTPTCLIFGAQQKPNENLPIRVAAILPCGGDLRTPPEESPLWHTLAGHHDEPGFSNEQVIVVDRPRREMAKHPWNSDVGSESPPPEAGRRTTTLKQLVSFLSGFVSSQTPEEVFLVSADFARRTNLSPELLSACQTGDDIRDWSSAHSSLTIRRYDRAWKPVDLAEISHLDATFLSSCSASHSGRAATFSGRDIR